MRFAFMVIAMALSAVGTTVSQTPASFEAVASLDLPILATRSSGTTGPALLFHRYGQHDFVLRGKMPAVLMSISANGTGETLLTANAVSSSAADGKWLFVQVWTGSQAVSHLFNLETGQDKTIAVGDIARSAALSENRLALLLGRGGESTLAIYDCYSGAQQFSTAITASEGAFLSFSRTERLLLVEREKARITPIAVRNSLVVRDPVQLTGSWVENALARAESIKQSAKPIAANVKFGISTVTAHATSTSGKDLFFLLGSKRNEGARIIEVDDDGRLLGTYHLGTEQAGSSPKQGTIQVINDHLIFLGTDGLIREYHRP